MDKEKVRTIVKEKRQKKNVTIAEVAKAVGKNPTFVAAALQGNHRFTADEAKKVIADAKAVADAGAFCIVVEGVMEEIAEQVTEAVGVPIIGIGASPKCDGQVLVTEDMLGLFERTPRFVKRYADLASEIGAAVGQYAEEVRTRAFPTGKPIPFSSR